jgi:hypothetical protein
MLVLLKLGGAQSGKLQDLLTNEWAPQKPTLTFGRWRISQSHLAFAKIGWLGIGEFYGCPKAILLFSTSWCAGGMAQSRDCHFFWCGFSV